MNDSERCKIQAEERHPRIGIYTGKGASHSWLWFVEVFDRAGLFDVSFLNEADLQGRGLDRCDVLAMSGGDTFGVAEALGPCGADNLKRFITGGGLYIGSCAGAYLPLRSSKEHLNLFNLVPAKIANLTQRLPEPVRLREKFCTAYGCSFVFHPVRGAVRVATNGFPPFRQAPSLTAPLYGGPPMIAEEPTQVLASYSGFTDQTVFLVDEQLAADTVLGKAAVIRQPMGKGCLHLYGPHFEHPHFAKANQLLIDAMRYDLSKERVRVPDCVSPEETISGEGCRELLRDIKREISNSRIVAVGLELLSIGWTIGNKVYEPAKIREFIEPIWNRIRRLEKLDQLTLVPGQAAQWTEAASSTTRRLRQLKRHMDKGIDTLPDAKAAFESLNRISTLFLDMYFRTLRQPFHQRRP